MTNKKLGLAFVVAIALGSQVVNAADAADKSALYKSECGTCHMAYPAGFLPARSWEKIMTSLDKHFGENAELSATVVDDLTKYLTANAGEHTGNREMRKFASSMKDDSTLRISDLPYFKKEHRKIPANLVKDNPEVLSFSNCQKCHTKAESGSFGERDINIPGHGRWDD